MLHRSSREFNDLIQKMQEHNCGLVTAHRIQYTDSQNSARNRHLLGTLLDLGYSITSVEGTYIYLFGTDEAKEVRESAYFIEEITDQLNLMSDLLELGERFEQDSVLFIPKGGTYALLIGTSRQIEFPKYHTEVTYGTKGVDRPGDFLTNEENTPFHIDRILET